MEPQISFEFFPPHTAEGQIHLKEVSNKLLITNPRFFSVTYGAGGSTQDRTFDTVLAIRNSTQIETAPHISCISSTSDGIRNMLFQYKNQNIKRLIVLRGDLPSGMGSSVGEFPYARDLIAFIRAESADYFHIEVAAYPEFHPETLDSKKNLEHFRQKVMAGANSAITQYFYNPDSYFYFVDVCRRSNIDIPIVPGIMPISNYHQLARFSNLCGAEIPRWIRYRLESFGNDLESLRLFGEEVVANLCERLLKGGAPGLHFYTVNKADPSLGILQKLRQ